MGSLRFTNKERGEADSTTKRLAVRGRVQISYSLVLALQRRRPVCCPGFSSGWVAVVVVAGWGAKKVERKQRVASKSWRLRVFGLTWVHQ